MGIKHLRNRFCHTNITIVISKDIASCSSYVLLLVHPAKWYFLRIHTKRTRDIVGSVMIYFKTHTMAFKQKITNLRRLAKGDSRYQGVNVHAMYLEETNIELTKYFQATPSSRELLRGDPQPHTQPWSSAGHAYDYLGICDDLETSVSIFVYITRFVRKSRLFLESKTLSILELLVVWGYINC